jgi:hypothetical protein
VDAFTQKGHGDLAESWVGRGPNKQIAPPELEKAIGSDVLENLSKLTGLPREEILSRTLEAPSRGCRQVYAGRSRPNRHRAFETLGQVRSLERIVHGGQARFNLSSNCLASISGIIGSCCVGGGLPW